MCRFPVFLLLYSTITQNEREEMYGSPLKAFPFPPPLLPPPLLPQKNSFPISSSFSKDRERKNREKKKSRQNKFDIERFPFPEKVLHSMVGGDKRGEDCIINFRRKVEERTEKSFSPRLSSRPIQRCYKMSTFLEGAKNS